jgi:hypothetical protein
MENAANLGLFAVLKIVSEYAERLYASMEKTPRSSKLCISQLIIIFLLSTLLWDGLSQKSTSCYCPFKALLNCDVRGQGGCRGGHVDQAWHYTRRHG